MIYICCMVNVHTYGTTYIRTVYCNKHIVLLVVLAVYTKSHCLKVMHVNFLCKHTHSIQLHIIRCDCFHTYICRCVYVCVLYTIEKFLHIMSIDRNFSCPKESFTVTWLAETS